MRIAIGQINPIIGDFEGNAEKILSYIREAHALGVELIVFPEMSVCGYPPMDLLDRESFVEANLKTLRKIQQKVPPDLGVMLGYVDKNRSEVGKKLANSVTLIQNGKILFTQSKSLLPTYDVFDEARYFEPASEGRVVAFRGERIGIAICEDTWWDAETSVQSGYPRDPVKSLLDQGATLILSPSASPFHSGKLQTRLEKISRIGKSSGVPVIYVNMVGGNDSLIFDGRSLVTSKEGKCVFLGKAFTEDLAIVDTGKPGREVSLEVDKYIELEQALVLGIRDYLGKCGFKQVHVGLSGGIDSALVTALAVKAAGPGQVRAFSLPSRYSSSGSIADAERLAGNLGIELTRLPIEETFKAGLSTLASVFKGRKEDITEENLQARIRGTLLMAYANKFHSLLLATGNKSELATGYCTLYGDMCGGLAVIGDLLKTEVYALARSLNREKELISEAIFIKEPSAELRPNQRDRDSLPPYDLLDRILELYLIENRNPGEIAGLGFARSLVDSVVTLVERAEYKRRQAPPVLKVTPRAFGTGRRIPIARAIPAP